MAGICVGHEDQQVAMESLSPCRDPEGQCVRVASGVTRLPRRVCVAAVHSRVKLHLCVELPVVQARPRRRNPEPQAPGLQRQLLHRRGREGGRWWLPLPG